MTRTASPLETRVLSESEVDRISGAGATLPVSLDTSLILSSTLEARIARLRSELHEALPRF